MKITTDTRDALQAYFAALTDKVAAGTIDPATAGGDVEQALTALVNSDPDLLELLKLPADE